jgi:hypothetical protein
MEVTISDIYIHVHICFTQKLNKIPFVRFEVFTAVTKKNAVFCDVTPCSSGKNRRFGGT